MADRTYWLDLFTGKTWDEFKAAGGTVSGFRTSRWKSVQRMKQGDYLLCYITGVSRFVAVLEVTGKGFKDTTPIWADDDFPCRVNVDTVVEVPPEHAVPIQTMREQLSIFEDGAHPNA